jgi:hypothetical protein
VFAGGTWLLKESDVNLFIIARREPLMYEAMKQSFAGHADIEVILDRRRR